MSTKRTALAPAIDADDCRRWLAAKAKLAEARAAIDALTKG